MECGAYKIELGCGPIGKDEGYIKLDTFDYTEKFPGMFKLRDLEHEGLPFCDNSAINISARNFLEHVSNLRFVLNECHRVLKKSGELYVLVPVWTSRQAFKDPTHVRFFDEVTFTDYFMEREGAAENGFKKWQIQKLGRLDKHNDIIECVMMPRK